MFQSSKALYFYIQALSNRLGSFWEIYQFNIECKVGCDVTVKWIEFIEMYFNQLSSPPFPFFLSFLIS